MDTISFEGLDSLIENGAFFNFKLENINCGLSSIIGRTFYHYEVAFTNIETNEMFITTTFELPFYPNSELWHASIDAVKKEIESILIYPAELIYVPKYQKKI